MVNLSTPSQELVAKIWAETDKAEYWHRKRFAGKTAREELSEKYTRIYETTGKRTFIGECSEYKSPSGNRWYVADKVRKEPEGFATFIVSFVYYETYESIGCFAPAWQIYDLKAPAAKGVNIFTSHFFQRYCEREGVEYKSRDMLMHFLLDFQYIQGDPCHDERHGDYEVWRMRRKGIIKAVRRKDCPLVMEMRTFLADKNLSPADLKRYKKLMGDTDGDDFLRRLEYNENAINDNRGEDIV
jgi:hypothetical protein